MCRRAATLMKKMQKKTAKLTMSLEFHMAADSTFIRMNWTRCRWYLGADTVYIKMYPSSHTGILSPLFTNRMILGTIYLFNIGWSAQTSHSTLDQITNYYYKLLSSFTLLRHFNFNHIISGIHNLNTSECESLCANSLQRWIFILLCTARIGHKIIFSIHCGCCWRTIIKSNPIKRLLHICIPSCLLIELQSQFWNSE